MTVLACVEVGGSGCQTVVFDGDAFEVVDGAVCPAGAELRIAVPGLIADGRVVAASNLDWYDVDPADALDLDTSAAVVLNDAEAAALGEAALRADGGDLPDLVFVGLGTGVGGSVIINGAVSGDNLFGHAPGFSGTICRCGRTGCLETVVSGWALPDVLDRTQVAMAAAALGRAIEAEPLATPRLVVLAGGMVRAHPSLVDALGAVLPDRRIEITAAPVAVKSASAWGLRHASSPAASRP